MFLPDARSYPPGAPAAIGIDAIHALTVDFLSAGVTERGKYINVWKQVNGRWRIQANIWNADPPDSTPKSWLGGPPIPSRFDPHAVVYHCVRLRVLDAPQG